MIMKKKRIENCANAIIGEINNNTALYKAWVSLSKEQKDAFLDRTTKHINYCVDIVTDDFDDTSSYNTSEYRCGC